MPAESQGGGTSLFRSILTKGEALTKHNRRNMNKQGIDESALSYIFSKENIPGCLAPSVSKPESSLGTLVFEVIVLILRSDVM